MDYLEAYLEAVSQGDEQRAEASLAGLIILGANALEGLKPLLSHPNPDSRWWGVRALAEIPEEEVIPLLIEALGDEEVSVRQCAALALCRHPNSQAISNLISTLNETDRLLARLAGDALVALGAPAVPPLLELMQNGPQLARLEAARALALIGDSRAAPILYKALEDESAYVRHWADDGLKRMGIGMVFFNP